MKAAFFYADDGMLAPIEPGCLHLAFETLTVLFDWVGIRTKVRKNVRIVCRPFRADRVQSDEAYTQRIKGEGRRFK